MGGTAHQVAFAGRLRELKERSGRSYQALGKRCGVSSSTVHRYCTGGGVPAEFVLVERLARACGASREELAELHRLWAFAQVQREVERAVEEPPVVRRPARRWQPAFGVAVVALLTFGLVAAAVPGRRRCPRPR